MIIDSSLARGLHKRERRRLTSRLKTLLSVEGKGTRAAWLRRAHSRVMKSFDKYVILDFEEGTKPANTIKDYLVIAPATKDEYIAFVVVLIKIKGKDQSHDFKEAPIAITHHAYERVIQSVGHSNVKEAVEIMHFPILSMLSQISSKSVLAEGEEKRICDPFGMFFFRGDSEGQCLLKTVIKADALEGEKLREWEAATRIN